MDNIDTKATTLFGLATLKGWLVVTGIDTTADARLVIAADGATAEIEQETGVYFVERQVVETFSGNGKYQHALKHAPVASITSFVMDGNPVDPSTYVVDDETGILTFLSGPYPTVPVAGFNWGIKNITVTYQAGFDIKDGPNLPSDVYRAGLDLTKAIFDELTTGAIAATSVNLGGSTMVIKAAKRPPSVQRVIDKWVGSAMRA